MRILVAGRPVRVSSKVGQVLAQQGDAFRPDGGWPATIDDRRDQLIAVRETGLALVTDDGLRTLPWSDISAVEASDTGSLQQTFLALTNGDRHSIIHYGRTDRTDLRRMVPQHLLEHPPMPRGTDEPSEPAIPIHDAPGGVRTEAPAGPGTPSLYGRAADVAYGWLLTFFWLMVVGSLVALLAFYQIGLDAGLDENQVWAPALGASGAIVGGMLPIVAAAHITTRVLDAKAASTAADA